jgi:two-component system response regulator HydG
VLQDGSYEPLGGTRMHQSDCRIIAATNADLPAEVRAGQFREDLFYRLNVITIRMPPLRDRGDDVLLLARHFLGTCSTRHRKAVDAFTPDALAALTRWEWPGNIRELEHAVERAVVLTPGHEVGVEHLPEPIRAAVGPAPVADASHIQVPVGTPLEDVERLMIAEALRRTGGNKVQAASLLGISPRTIYRKQGPGEGTPE